MKNRLRALFTLFFVFLKVGAFTFGGGYAMIPLIQREIVEKKKYIKEEEAVEILAVAGLMPGSIAVNTATFVGQKTAGFLGALAAILGSILPSFIVVYLIIFLLNQFMEYEVVKFALNGIRIAVVALIFKALLSLWKQSPKAVVPYIIIAASFILITFVKVNAVYVIIGAALLGLAASLFAARRLKNEEGGQK